MKHVVNGVIGLAQTVWQLMKVMVVCKLMETIYLFFSLYRLYALTSSGHVNKCEMDSGQKSAYYAAILSDNNDRGLWSLSTAQEVILH